MRISSMLLYFDVRVYILTFYFLKKKIIIVFYLT